MGPGTGATRGERSALALKIGRSAVRPRPWPPPRPAETLAAVVSVDPFRLSCRLSRVPEQSAEAVGYVVTEVVGDVLVAAAIDELDHPMRSITARVPMLSTRSVVAAVCRASCVRREALWFEWR